jgi:hypothetical protein
MRKYFTLLIACLFFMAIANSAVSHGQDVAVGVNIIDPYKLSVDAQNTMLDQMKAAGVKVIRASVTQDAKGVDFAEHAWSHGIKIEWLIYHFGGYDPFGKLPLSAADPEQFRATFAPILASLESKGIVFAAFELGNEINLSGTNPELPITPGKGVQLSLNQLKHDPEGQQIGKGFDNYLKLLAVLKDVRDHSRLNQRTPILTAGLGSYEQGDGPLPGKPKGDIVSINSTLEYMRAHGLDSLVDGYAIHMYPKGNPGDPNDAARRKANLAKYDFTECRATGSKEGKPCWITEWGFKNVDMSCPIDDSGRASLVREMMSDFRPYVQQGRLAGLLYFSWNTNPAAKTVEYKAVWRCDSITESGKLSIDAGLLK